MFEFFFFLFKVSFSNGGSCQQLNLYYISVRIAAAAAAEDRGNILYGDFIHTMVSVT